MTILNSILQTINLKSYLFQLVNHIFPQKTMKKIHLIIYYFYCIVYKTIEKKSKKVH